MRSLRFVLRSGLFLLSILLLAVSAAHAAGPVFLGTDPLKAAIVPVPVANLSSLGGDLVGNHYYADGVAGRVVQVTRTGNSSTLASGLNKPLIAVNYRGDVFIADTGTGRVLKSTAWPKRGTSVLVTVMKLHAIALDSASNVFILSGDQLVEIPVNGSPVTVATIPGASLLGTGPGADGVGALYVVSAQSGAYAAKKYTYSYSGGVGTVSAPLTNFLPNLPGASLANIFVDLRGDVITQVNVGGTGQVVLSSASGFQKALFTASSGPVPTAQDSLGNLYYVDGTSLMKIQLGTPSFENQYSRDGLTDPPYHVVFAEVQLRLNFGGTPDARWVFSQQPTETDFYEAGLASGSGPQTNPAKLYVYYLQNSRTPGTLRPVVNLTDQNNVTSLSLPMVANSMVAAEAYYLPAPNLRAHPNSQPFTAVNTTVPPILTVLSRCDCGTFDLDRSTGVITHHGHQIASGLVKVLGADVDTSGTLYVTQEGVTGVLRVTADGVSSHIANDISYPRGSTLDTLGNLFVVAGDNVVRLAPDGSETLFATPVSNGGYSAPLSVAVDLFDNVYVGYATIVNATHGAILKFTPAGTSTVVPTDTKKPTTLAMYPCGALFFGDGVRRTIAVVPGYKLEKYIGFGLPNPVNLRCGAGGNITGEDAAIPGRTFKVGSIPLGASDSFSLDFGKVPVGGERVLTLSAVAVGSYRNAPEGTSGGATFFNLTGKSTGFAIGGGDGGFNDGYMFVGQEYGGRNLVDIRLVFQPSEAVRYGPASLPIQDDNSAPFANSVINLYGTGVAKPPVSTE